MQHYARLGIFCHITVDIVQLTVTYFLWEAVHNHPPKLHSAITGVWVQSGNGRGTILPFKSVYHQNDFEGKIVPIYCLYIVVLYKKHRWACFACYW